MAPLAPDDFAQHLFHLLCLEILAYCRGKRTIAVLLSGGMDSRVSAMAVHKLITERELDATPIAVTWGLPNSRDCIYAQRIAQRLHWDWVHLPLTPENLYENIDITAGQGCLFPPLHLHAIPRIKDLSGIEGVIVSSFGDSIGRAVYSGRHVTNLVPMRRYLRNWFGLLNARAYKSALPQAISDLCCHRERFPRNAEHAHLEVERQSHYMRRMLNPCLKYLDQFIPTFQSFTSPEVLKFVWSVDPRYRTDRVYEAIAKNYMSILSDIPWSKTGIPFGAEKVTADNHPKDYHSYGTWIRKNLYDYLYNLSLSDEIAGLNVFNMDNLKQCLQFNRQLKTRRLTFMDEISVWLASLAKMIRSYGIKGLAEQPNPSRIIHAFGKLRCAAELMLFEKAMDLKK